MDDIILAYAKHTVNEGILGQHQFDLFVQQKEAKQNETSADSEMDDNCNPKQLLSLLIASNFAAEMSDLEEVRIFRHIYDWVW